MQSGPPDPLDYLRRAIRKGRVSHAYVLLGPEGSGKRALALDLARMVFCTGDASPCRRCAPCKLVEHGNHPGVSVYRPEEGRTVVDIDTVRQLCERSHFTRDHSFVAILEQADRLTVPAANALLKTLEEPPGEFVVILTAPSAGALLPTIVSRSHRLYVSAAASSAPPDGVDTAALQEVTRPDFFASTDPRQWIGRVVPDSTQPRERMRLLIEATISERRRALEKLHGYWLDRGLAEIDELLELHSAVDGNVHPDLVMERFIAIARRDLPISPGR